MIGTGFDDIFLFSPFLNELDVLLSNGDGTFENTRPLFDFSPAYPVNGFLYDVDLDGNLDFIGTGYASYLALYRGHGNGTFAGAELTYSLPECFGIAMGDINADGKPDIVGGCSDGQIVIHKNRGDGLFDRGEVYIVNNTGRVGVAMGDINGDGKNEVAAATESGLVVMRQDGAGGLVLDSFMGNTLISYIEIADFNKDSLEDIYIGYGYYGEVLLGNRDGSLSSAAKFLVPNPYPTIRKLSVTDMNGDGWLDILPDGSTNMIYPLFQVPQEKQFSWHLFVPAKKRQE